MSCPHAAMIMLKMNEYRAGPDKGRIFWHFNLIEIDLPRKMKSLIEDPGSLER